MYERRGAYAGAVPLEELATRAWPLFLSWGQSGSATAHTGVREAFERDVKNAIPGEWETAMLVGLREAGGSLSLHRDEVEAGLSRYHLVLATNERCWYFHDGDWQQLDRGRVYRFDPTKEHAAVNWGETARIHLVVDVREP